MRMIRLSEQYVGELIEGRIGRRGPQLAGSALAIGSFDGLHRGHQELLRGVLAARDRLDLAAGAVFTFTQHPRQTLDPGSAPFLLTTWREKLSVLNELGCQVVVAADFCPQLAALGYRDFVAKFLVGYLGMKHLVAGHDVHLGAGRARQCAARWPSWAPNWATPSKCSRPCRPAAWWSAARPSGAPWPPATCPWPRPCWAVPTRCGARSRRATAAAARSATRRPTCGPWTR